MNGWCRLGPAAAAGLALSLAVGVARADASNPTPEEVSAARELAKDGVRLARQGNCEAAIPKLERARDLFVAPVIPAVAFGECLIRTGQIVRGTEVLQIVTRANLGSHPEKFNLDAKATAQVLLNAAQPKIAKLVVQIEGPPGAVVTVTVDKEPLPRSLLGIGRPSDPGVHLVEASGVGVLPASQSVTLAEGQEASVSLKLDAAPVAAALVSVTETAAPKPATNDATVSRSKVPGVALLTVGGAGIAVGAVTGVLALSKQSTLNSACPNHACQASSASDISSLKTLSWVSTIGFAAGGVTAAVGTILLLRSLSDTPKSTGLTVMPSVGLGSVSVVGEF